MHTFLMSPVREEPEKPMVPLAGISKSNHDTTDYRRPRVPPMGITLRPPSELFLITTITTHDSLNLMDQQGEAGGTDLKTEIPDSPWVTKALHLLATDSGRETDTAGILRHLGT